jgi:hypothetical protein
MVTKNQVNIVVEAAAIIASVYAVAQFVPQDVFNSGPATGGDTGSHFWPLKVLHDYGLPHGAIRPWNPGNNGGEGILVHYFPLAFILMAVAGYVIPLGLAFNLGTILPAITLPVAVWASLRIMALPFPAPALGAIFSTAAILNEGHRMWGGNGVSTAVGQFSHMYALNFVLLAVACLWREMGRRRFPWLSGALFSLVALSHGYVFWGVPCLIGLPVLLKPTGTFFFRLRQGALSGLLAILLGAWFVGPMTLNNSWTTPHTMTWVFTDRLAELFPAIFDPVLAIFVLFLNVLVYFGCSRDDRASLRVLAFWLAAGLLYVAMFFAFRWLRLVDVRAVPQTQLFGTIAGAILVAMAVSKLPRVLTLTTIVVLTGFIVWWDGVNVATFPAFMRHNYSGWATKPNYGHLLDLTSRLKGNFSQPRIGWEHNVKANNVGTPRAFEMLPYFANRATTESLYLQSTLLAPMIYSFTSEISKKSSCPFHRWPCMRQRLKESAAHMALLGVQELILSSDVSLKNAAEASFLEKRFSVGPWTVYQAVEPVRMVETFSTSPLRIPFDNFRERYWEWYQTYSPTTPFLITAAVQNSLPLDAQLLPTKECHPSTEVDFSGIYLKTDCPGVAHYLKYAYNPSFTASGGEDIFIVSPGFLGMVPRSETVKLTYGDSFAWRLCRWISLCTATVLLAGGMMARRRRSSRTVNKEDEGREDV